MGKTELQIGDIVYHDFSGEEGKIIDIRQDPNDYNYGVQWRSGQQDWYKEEVLLKKDN